MNRSDLKEIFIKIYNRYIDDIKNELKLAREILPSKEMKDTFLSMAKKPLSLIKQIEDRCKGLIDSQLPSNGDKMVEMTSFSNIIHQSNIKFKEEVGDV